TFEVAAWEEDAYTEMDDDRKLSQADVAQNFAGDIEGSGSVRWQMCYRPDGTADWVGMQHVDGRIGDRSGSFVLRTAGTFDGATAAGEWSVVTGSGTGALETLTGSGRMEAPMGSAATYVLDYEL
ncbi:MAG TPA: DUF3224 domain-containing protein, partial [Euzebyales bacterium]|nr:DUF3224 domain-containing protein [Euzebyales bacterium]